MASTNCWRCLARPSQRLFGPASMISCSTSTTAAFSTSTQLLAAGQKSTEPGMSRHIRAGKRLVLGGKKKRFPDKTKPPAPGERKAFRKRIILSNNNALQVRGLDELSPAKVVDPDAIGTVVSIPDPVVDQLRGCEAFKPSQNWSLFRSPHMLIRDETVDLAKQMTDAVAKKETLRIAITGDKGSGKSMLGLQALATGFMNKWVVINIPEGQELTTAATEYAQIPHSEMYAQPTYVVKLMQAIYNTNLSVLSQCRVEMDHMHLSISVSRGMSLAALLNATKEPEFAWPVFQSFWRELLLPGRPPILFSLDGLAHIMRVSDYRSPSFQLIHSFDLGLVRMYTDALGGKTSFPNGAVVLAVTSKGCSPIIPSVEVALGQAAALQEKQVSPTPDEIEIPQRDPFCRRYDERVFDALKGIRILDVHGVSRPEARALMEYWAASGIIRMRVDEKSVSEKWTLSGGGVLGEIERSVLYDIRL